MTLHIDQQPSAHGLRLSNVPNQASRPRSEAAVIDLMSGDDGFDLFVLGKPVLVAWTHDEGTVGVQIDNMGLRAVAALRNACQAHLDSALGVSS